MKAIRWVVLGGLLAVAPAGAGLFYDDFEDAWGGWSGSGTWSNTTSAAHSPTRSATDSPDAYYTNQAQSALTLAAGVDLTTAERPALRYYRRHALEPDYDFVHVEVSTNSGAAWHVLRSLTGSQGSWVRDQVDLQLYAGASDLRLRFRFAADESVVMDGFYVDDILLGEAPPPVTLFTNAATPVSIALAWSTSAAPDFAAYHLYRAASTGVTEAAGVLVAVLPDRTATAVTDIAVSPKSSYHYRLLVVSSNELRTWSNEVEGRTPLGMDFPFLDNGEGGGGTWIADAPWALATNACFSGALGWTDSPEGAYTNNLNVALTLVEPLSLLGTIRPIFSYSHRYHLLSGDNGLAEISTNHGASWMVLASYTAASSSWLRARHDLSAYTNAQQVLVRFRLTTDSGGTAGGWAVDDISVSEAPETVPAPVLDQMTSHAMRVSWLAHTNLAFRNYAIFRSITSGVGLQSVLAGEVFDPSATTFTDTNLALDTVYYYRVYAVNPWGGYSLDSVAESSERTLNHPWPFSDGFEGGLEEWNLSGAWDVTTEDAAEGSHALCDSPGTLYDNNVDATAQTSVDLRGADWPVLKFWDRHALVGNDRGYLELSADGSGWWRIYGVQGTRTNWAEQVVDLSPYKGASNLRIKFHFVSDGSGQGDGWYVDHVRVSNHVGTAKGATLYERFDAAPTNWLVAGWWLEGSAQEGAGALHNNIAGVDHSIWGAYRMLVYDGWLDLSGWENPQVGYWLKWVNGYAQGFNLQVSTNGGVDWASIEGLGESNSGGNWVRRQYSLAGYRGTNVRVRVYTGGAWDYQYPNDVWLDKLTIKERPAGVIMDLPVPGLKTVGLTWSGSGLGAEFKEYRVYRSADANVDWNDTLIGLFTNVATVSMTDTDLTIGQTYYYGIYAVDTNDLYSAISTRSTTTVPVSAPFDDDLESLANWNNSGSWGVDHTIFAEGAGSVTESPEGDYVPNQNAWIQTAVNLVGLQRPVLRFQDRYLLGTGDRGYLEISTDGANWWRAYGVMGMHGTWSEQALDLSAYKLAANLRLRFTFISDGSVQSEGWNIDALRIADEPDAVEGVGVYASFDQEPATWLKAGWWRDTQTVWRGASALHNNIPGVDHSIWGAHRMMTSSHGFDLSGAADPYLTYWIKWTIGYAQTFYVQLSTNGGQGWVTVDAIGESSSPGWVRRQVSLPSYRGSNVVVRFFTGGSTDYHYPCDVAVDDFGLGDPAPAAPVPLSPTPFEAVGMLRPTLVSANAHDYQTDALTYRYDVFRDEELSDLVAQVPALAAGATSTAWQVDVNLSNNAQYWWRCRASDGSNDGPWSVTSTFYVNETNTPPVLVQVAGPPKGATLRTASGILSWYPATDPDVGDVIVQYHIQVDDDPAYASPEVDYAYAGPSPAPTGEFVTISRPLYTLAGYEALGMISNYFWRIRAQDSRFAWSAWTAGGYWFIYGVPAPDPASFTRNANGTLTVSWDVGSENWYVQWAPSLTSGWQTVAGPLGVNNWTLAPDPERASGFYRISGE